MVQEKASSVVRDRLVAIKAWIITVCSFDRPTSAGALLAPVLFLERFGDHISSQAIQSRREITQVAVGAVGLFLLTAPAAAQDFCSSGPGQLLGMAVNSGIALVVTAILIGILGGAALRSVGLRVVGNLLIGGAGVAILVLVGGMWFADTALAFVPGASMDSACGSI